MSDRLVFVDDRQPGITRRALDGSWAYYDPAGAQIADDELICRLAGNTPAIARKSYIHPILLEIASNKDAQDRLRSELCLPRKTRRLSRYERGLIEFLGNTSQLAEP